MPTAFTSSRPLGFAERYLWRVDKLSCLNCAAMATVSGVLDEARLRDALDAVQREQPFWRVGITIDGRGRPRFTRDAPHLIPLDIQPYDPDTRRAAILRSLATPFSDGTTPLLRCLWLHGPNVSLLTLIFHHAIMDGRSGIFWMRRLVAYWAEGSLRPSRTGSSLPEPVEHRYPSKFKGVSGFRRLGWMLLRGLGSAVRSGV